LSAIIQLKPAQLKELVISGGGDAGSAVETLSFLVVKWSLTRQLPFGLSYPRPSPMSTTSSTTSSGTTSESTPSTINNMSSSNNDESNRTRRGPTSVDLRRLLPSRYTGLHNLSSLILFIEAATAVHRLYVSGDRDASLYVTRLRYLVNRMPEPRMAILT
jgi:hypothetical protein